MPPSGIPERLRELLAADASRGFDLGVAPLLRVTLVRAPGGRLLCVDTHHHLLLDGWSHGILVDELRKRYDALARGRRSRPAAPRPFRDFVDWLGARDPTSDEGFWRAELAGVEGPTPLPAARGIPAAVERGRPAAPLAQRVTVPPDVVSGLRRLVRRRRVTTGSVVEAAWALLLARWAGEDDVVLGTTVAGRPSALPGAESMVGLFINTVPVRVRIPRQGTLGDLVEQVHARRGALLEHEATPPIVVQECSGLPSGVPLFESLLTFNTVAMLGGGGASAASAPERDVLTAPRPAPTNHALSLVVTDLGHGMVLDATADPHRYDPGDVLRVLGQLTGLLADVVTDPDRPLAQVSL